MWLYLPDSDNNFDQTIEFSLGAAFLTLLLRTTKKKCTWIMKLFHAAISFYVLEVGVKSMVWLLWTRLKHLKHQTYENRSHKDYEFCPLNSIFAGNIINRNVRECNPQYLYTEAVAKMFMHLLGYRYRLGTSWRLTLFNKWLDRKRVLCNDVYQFLPKCRNAEWQKDIKRNCDASSPNRAVINVSLDIIWSRTSCY